MREAPRQGEVAPNPAAAVALRALRGRFEGTEAMLRLADGVVGRLAQLAQVLEGDLAELQDHLDDIGKLAQGPPTGPGRESLKLALEPAVAAMRGLHAHIAAYALGSAAAIS